MTRPARQKESRSLRLYARLLELYPPSFLQRHRAEMLQNFADLEDAAASKAKLWLLIGKDLAMSLTSHFFGSRLGHYVIAVLVTWILIFAVGYFLLRPDARPSGFACFRRLSPRDAGHVLRDTSLWDAAKQHFALFQVTV
jgi:hypothetical protein